MSRMRLVMAFEFSRTIRKRTFWLRTLSIPVLLGALLGLLVFSGRVANQAEEVAKTSTFSLLILDQSGYITPEIMVGVGAQPAQSIDDGREKVRTGEVAAFYFYPKHPGEDPVQVYARDDGIVSNDKYSAVALEVLKAGVTASVGGGEPVKLLTAGPEVKMVTYQNGEQAKGWGRVIAPGIFLILFYAVIVLLGNQMLTSTTEEKENRVIEMLLTSVSARSIIVGKIIALMALGCIQIAAILVPLGIAYFGFREQLNITSIDLSSLSFAPLPIVVGAAIFVGGLMLFTGMLVAIGAAVPTAKEAGGFFAFAMILVFVPVYALGVIVSSPEQVVVQVMSFFPLTAPITLMLRNAVGNLTPIETIVGLVILYASAIGLMALAIRIFRYGSLQYTRKLGLSEIFSRRA